MAPPQTILYTFYGDDFTGSTDVLEQLAIHGVPAVLFLAPPDPERLRQFPGIQALGVAGESRSRSPAWMTEILPRIFSSLRSFGAPVLHYKVCSTFDSSPQTGSIGRAIEIGVETLDPPFVPIVAGAPHLRRFVLDANLFASAPDGGIHRIDRHPMSRHPVTPMREPDLRRHLSAQTALPIGLISHTDLHSLDAASAALQVQLASNRRVILFDTVDRDSLDVIGRLLWHSAQRQPLFAAASSGLTAALIPAWRQLGLIPPAPPPAAVRPVSPLLVVSGSCSAATARQIGWALEHGFQGLPVDPAQLTGELRNAYRDGLIGSAVQHLERSQDLVVYTALGHATSSLGGEDLGVALGALAHEIVARCAVRRIVFCGGDTSSHAVQQLGLSALTWAASLQTGAPVCRAHFADPSAPPLELVLKGGQVGTDDFFARARGGPGLSLH